MHCEYKNIYAVNVPWHHFAFIFAEISVFVWNLSLTPTYFHLLGCLEKPAQ